MDGKLHALLIYIRQNLEAEPMSGLMPGGPVWNVEVIGLLDEIARIWEVPKEEIGAIVNGDVIEEEAAHA